MKKGSKQPPTTVLSLLYSPAKTTHVNAILKDADDHTLVIWDVDGVLLNGCDRIFHSENIYSGLNDKYVTYIENKYNLTAEQRNQFLSQLLLNRPVQLVDNFLANIIGTLQTRHIKTIALTQFAVGPFGDIKSMEDWRIDELQKLGIKFHFAFDNLEYAEIDKLNAFNHYHPVYKHGILFCNGYTKGDVLGAFLDMLKWTPHKIIFIDDKMEPLKSVQNELKKREISFIGLHYNAALDLPSHIDDNIVKLQYEYFIKNRVWLIDQIAREWGQI